MACPQYGSAEGATRSNVFARTQTCGSLLMKKFCLLTIGVLASAGALGSDEPFNGTKPLDCQPLTGHDCLPTEQSCKPLKPEPGKNLNLHIDVDKMTMKTPYRNDAMPIQS